MGEIDPVVVLIIWGADEVEVSSHDYREGGSGNLLLQLNKEGWGATMVCRAIDDHDFPFELESPLKDLHTNKEFSPVHAAHLEGGILYS